MVDILDEVRDELKQESFNNIMKKYGPYVLGSVAAILIGVSIKVWWNDYKANQAYESGSIYMSSLLDMRSLKIDKAMDNYQSLMDKQTPYSPLAGLSVAAFAGFKQDFVKSSFVYQSIADNRDFDDVFRDYAEFLAVKTKIEAKELDSKDAISALHSYLEGQSIFKHSARELLASLYLKQGDKTKASEALNQIISDPEAPKTLRTRAEELFALTL